MFKSRIIKKRNEIVAFVPSVGRKLLNISIAAK